MHLSSNDYKFNSSSRFIKKILLVRPNEEKETHKARTMRSHTPNQSDKLRVSITEDAKTRRKRCRSFFISEISRSSSLLVSAAFPH
ncbi:hypothetical protein QVD17_15055 [Tagetes erecta]|uniref:Uncharacterized protein n=1 Tax=Tagetes erecta TaxID=13708 RepID=A0AAD8KP86_TARER|nr:hypothetical protein QVD17_15055 [Tagetes erecta]